MSSPKLSTEGRGGTEVNTKLKQFLKNQSVIWLILKAK